MSCRSVRFLVPAAVCWFQEVRVPPGGLGSGDPHPLRSTRWDLLWGVRTCRPFVKAVRDGGHVIVCRTGVVGLETGRRIIGIVRNVDGRLGGGCREINDLRPRRMLVIHSAENLFSLWCWCGVASGSSADGMRCGVAGSGRPRKLIDKNLIAFFSVILRSL